MRAASAVSQTEGRLRAGFRSSLPQQTIYQQLFQYVHILLILIGAMLFIRTVAA